MATEKTPRELARELEKHLEAEHVAKGQINMAHIAAERYSLQRLEELHARLHRNEAN